MSNSLSSNFICVIIVTAKEKGKEQVKRNNNLGTIKANYRTWEKVDKNNNMKVSPANRNVPALVDGDTPTPVDKDALANEKVLVPEVKEVLALANRVTPAPTDQNASALTDRDIPSDRDILAPANKKVFALVNKDVLAYVDQDILVPTSEDIPADGKTQANKDIPAPIDGKKLLTDQEIPTVAVVADTFTRVFCLVFYFLAIAFFSLIYLTFKSSGAGNCTLYKIRTCLFKLTNILLVSL